jgi:hypothetical protein
VEGALDSVLGQDYPPQRLDVVVVDDGSTDATAEVVERVARRAGGRVRLIRRANGGLGAATSTALAAARGELIAICDADDRWLPGKVAAQVAVFRDRPEVSLVYGDMRVIDGDGGLLHESFFARQGVIPRRGRVLDALARENFTTNSTLMFRAGHAVAVPAESPYADYWLALHAAAAGEVEALDWPLAAYRLHGRNMCFGASDVQRQARAIRDEITMRRMVLSGALADRVGLAVLVETALGLELQARHLISVAGSALAEITRVTDAQRAVAAAALADAHDQGSAERRLRGYARAVLLDPFNAAARQALQTACASSQATAVGISPSS